MPPTASDDVRELRIRRGSLPYAEALKRAEAAQRRQRVREADLPTAGGDGKQTERLRIVTNPKMPHARRAAPTRKDAELLREKLSEADLEYLRGCSVLICTPCYGGAACLGYMTSLMRTKAALDELGVGVGEHFLSAESLIPRGRNGMVASFVQDARYSHLLFVDADISWHPSAVVRLLLSRKDLVAAIYPLKKYDWPAIYRYIREYDEARQGPFDPQVMQRCTGRYACNLAGGSAEPDADGFVRCSELPTGFMLISKCCVQTMVRHYGRDREYVNDAPEYDDELSAGNFYHFFDVAVDRNWAGNTPAGETQRLMSEDWAFSRLAAQCGVEAWGDPSAELTHTGQHTFHGQLAAKLAYARRDPRDRHRLLAQCGIRYDAR